MYTKKCRKSLKEITEDTNKWKGIPFYVFEDLILLKYPYYSKQSIDAMQSLSKPQWHFFQKKNSQIHMDYQGIPDSQNNLERRE